MNSKQPSQRLSRRRFTKVIASSSVAAGVSSYGHVASAQDRALGPLAGAPALAGSLHTDEATRRSYARDYGNIVHRLPRAVLIPGELGDVVEIVRFARRRGLRVVARGQGHQPFGQAQLEDGIVVDMRSLGAVLALREDRALVEAGISWRALAQKTFAHGLGPAVLTNFLGLSVGGTLSIGGVGEATHRHGAQVDQVDALEVVTGEGELVACSERERADLFHGLLAGQGHCAILARARLRLVPVSALVSEYLLQYEDVATLLGDLHGIAVERRFDGAVGLIVRSGERWKCTLHASRQYGSPEAAEPDGLLDGLRHIRGSEQRRDSSYLDHADPVATFDATCAHADLGQFIPWPAAVTFLEEMLPRLGPTELGAANALRVFVWQRSRFQRPLLRVPESAACVYVALLRAETTDAAVVQQQLAGNRALYEQNRLLGGTLYPFSSVALSPAEWRAHYRESWPLLEHAKRHYDPDHVLGSVLGRTA